MTARELTLEMLMQVNEEERLSHQVIHRTLSQHPELSEADRAFATRMFHGTLERQLTLDWILERQTGRPVQKLKARIRNLLRMSGYQILFLQQVPNSAVCNEAVKLVKKRGMAGLSGFVNGVLRALTRNVEASGSTEAYLQTVAEDLTETERLCFLYSMPVWLVTYWQKLYPKSVVERMLPAFLEESPVTVRWNASRGTMEELKERLNSEGVEWSPAVYADNALRLSFRGSVSRLQAYREGRCSVQDESSILAGKLLPLKKDMLVLDLCAAPGGKALHAADTLALLGGGRVLARDVSEAKVAMIREQGKRLGLSNLQCQVWDARRPDPVLAGKADLVIADLPCSGIGVIGRKPDIKWKTEFDDVLSLASLQREILSTAVSYVKPGGYLCYSTCTVTKEENGDNVEYLKRLGMEPVSVSERLPKELVCAETDRGMLTLLPGIRKTDGFFAALLRKTAEK